jgi:hypothetical protein
VTSSQSCQAQDEQAQEAKQGCETFFKETHIFARQWTDERVQCVDLENSFG